MNLLSTTLHSSTLCLSQPAFRRSPQLVRTYFYSLHLACCWLCTFLGMIKTVFTQITFCRTWFPCGTLCEKGCSSSLMDIGPHAIQKIDPWPSSVAIRFSVFNNVRPRLYVSPDWHIINIICMFVCLPDLSFLRVFVKINSH